MTNTEKTALLTLSDRLFQLSSMERARFNGNEEKDEEIKRCIKPYMTWFESVAFDIKDVVELSDQKGWRKKDKLEEIIRLNL